jgi:hypothetical protein
LFPAEQIPIFGRQVKKQVVSIVEQESTGLAKQTNLPILFLKEEKRLLAFIENQ